MPALSDLFVEPPRQLTGRPVGATCGDCIWYDIGHEKSDYQSKRCSSCLYVPPIVAVRPSNRIKNTSLMTTYRSNVADTCKGFRRRL